MIPLTALAVFVAALGGFLTDSPSMFLGFKCQRRPGESEVAYFQREMARLDSVMQAMMAKNARAIERNKVRDKRVAALIRQCEAREAEADALRALAGGIADHPKCKLFLPPDPERERFLAETKAVREKVDEEQRQFALERPKKDAETRQLLEKMRELSKQLQDDIDKKRKK